MLLFFLVQISGRPQLTLRHAFLQSERVTFNQWTNQRDVFYAAVSSTATVSVRAHHPP